MRLQPSRASFRVRQPNQFNLSGHQPAVICEKTRKLMPTIVRLAQLMAVADPQKQYQLPVSSQEELEVQIAAFRDLVNERYFPLFGYDQDDDSLYEEVNQWEEGWINQTYHPLLDSIPVRPIGFADHDIDPSDYGDLVGLLYWLASAAPKTPKFDGGFTVEEHWSAECQAKFNPMAVTTILDGMKLQAPLIHLPRLIETVTKQTDTGMPARLTFFLDTCPLCSNFLGPEFSWAVENFTWFRDDWLLAKPIYEGNQELVRWSHRSPDSLKFQGS